MEIEPIWGISFSYLLPSLGFLVSAISSLLFMIYIIIIRLLRPKSKDLRSVLNKTCLVSSFVRNGHLSSQRNTIPQ